ncbi:23S rRNA (guanosine(2251)-2'-O)-methyltransferase RlmB [Holzapfeliella floricola]|uniref:tRNA-rRNA methyltransferase n=1 Tax=Holzapfeliella floricola DSM 23037 = JCM 16512 TaxID=1423744 RepID=A0A0R2DJG2_9LACO|nr:23S rRNA (guanosine(2251)-2'-O)-methyltransferase RlmB [Holzapfeliella floricola]KRN04240.1 tRNA-rRNA methyltransferase [Holzapfeliella floricola DSM 23037 = JCM 16512]
MNTDSDKVSQEFVYGKHAAVDYLKNNEGSRVNKIFLQNGVSADFEKEIKGLAKKARVVVQEVPKNKLEKLVGHQANHQGIVLTIASFEYADLDDTLVQLENKNPMILMLDSIEDPHNLGSILRTADATGVDAIIIPKHRATGLTSVVAKSSTGAINHVPVIRETNLVNTVNKMKKAGFWFFGTDMKGQDYRKWDAKGKTVLVIGNEGKGISRLLKEQMDQMLTIPMVGHVQSLNAGVASGVLMYQAFTSREV